MRRLVAVALVFLVVPLCSGCAAEGEASESQLVALSVRPSDQSIRVGDRLRLMLVARYADGSTRDVTRRATWRVSAPRAVRLERPGAVRARGKGASRVTATLSGRRAVTTVRVGARSIGPLRVSRVNPRYFVDRRGRLTYLAGSHTWGNLVDNGTSNPPPKFGYTAFLDFLQVHDLRVSRLWAWEQAWASSEVKGPYYFAPLVYRRTGPGRAIDGGLRFDLTKFNPGYFSRLRQRVVAARERGIYVVVMLFDGWSLERKGSLPGEDPWLGHPFNVKNNVNGIDGDARGNGGGEETHTLSSPRVTKLQELYVARVIKAVGDQPNVLYEVSNESSGGSLAWQNHIVRFIRSKEPPGMRHPAGITVEYPGGNNAGLLESSADWISPSGDINDPPAASGQKVIVVDTDHLCGVCGDPTFPWKAFTRGLNPLLMDPYDGKAIGLGALDADYRESRWPVMRRRLGVTQLLSETLDLARLAPAGGLSSSGYCLCDPRQGRQYVVYVPQGRSVTVDVSASGGPLRVEWVDPDTGVVTRGGRVAGGGRRSFDVAGSGDAVLVLRRVQ